MWSHNGGEEAIHLSLYILVVQAKTTQMGPGGYGSSGGQLLVVSWPLVAGSG